MEIDLFIPCFIDQLYPETAFNTVRVLERAGCTVHYNGNQTCCGQPFYNSGHWKDASKLARKFLNDFSGERPIVTPSASCSGFVIHHYPNLLQKDSQLTKKHAAISENMYELTDFLVNVLHKTELGVRFPHRVTYHDACSALREYGIGNEPRTLLQAVEDLTLVEMQERDTCCGFGGTFSIKNSAISTAMAERKVQFALAAGVEYIVSSEASCLMNLQGYIEKHQCPIQVLHIADLLSGSKS